MTFFRPGERFFLRFFLSLALCLHVSEESYAQLTRVTGRVYDPLTNEPIPFASILFVGTSVGKNADLDGNFSLETTQPVDSIRATFVGYLPATLPVRRGQTQKIDFALRANKFDLPEVTIVAGENPAIILLRKVIDNKPKNDPDRFSALQYETYNKLEFDINNITDKFKRRRLFKPFAFAFENIDTTATNKKPYLPVFLTESVSDVYQRKNPKLKKEIIRASKISGVENATVSQYLGDLYAKINVYDAYIYLFGKGFVSPISGISQLYYKYMLVDSAYLDEKWCYKVTFHPRRKQELTFNGEFWVHDTTFAIRKLNMRISGDANINFIEDLAVVHDYAFVDNQTWLLKKEVLVVNLAPTETKSKETTGFIGRKTTFYRNFKLNDPLPEKFYSEGHEVIVQDDAYRQSSAFWDSTRGESLSESERKIYAMIDTIKTIPAYKRWADLVRVAASGYKETGLFEIGPIYTFVSSNPIEGLRLRFGGQTSNKFSTRLVLSGYSAYGFKDERFKYGGTMRYFTSKDPRQYFGLEYKKDVEQLGVSANAFQNDNVFATLLRRQQALLLNDVEMQKVYFEHEWKPGFSNRLSVTHTEYAPLGRLNFTYYANDARTDSSSRINNTDLTFYVRFANHERFVSGEVDRLSLGTNWPIFHLQYQTGLKGLLESNFTYHKLRFKVEDYLYPGNFGTFYFTAEAGKIWGTLPYPLLYIHPGNNSFVYDRSAFNLMNFYEFVSDEYISFKAEHNFGGFFLDRIPALRKLKWREMATFSAVTGQVSAANRNILSRPDAFYSLGKPYIEAGVGISNIFRILRIDNIWRLSYLDHPDIAKVAILGTIHISF